MRILLGILFIQLVSGFSQVILGEVWVADNNTFGCIEDLKRVFGLWAFDSQKIAYLCMRK